MFEYGIHSVEAQHGSLRLLDAALRLRKSNPMTWTPRGRL